MAAALSISGRLVEGQTLTMEKVGTFTSVRWQTWTGHDWVDIGTPNSLTYVIPSGAAGRSYRVVGEMAGGTYQGAPTGNVFVDSNRAGFTPVISGGAQSATVAEQASPSTPYAYLSFTDADKDNYANGSLTAMTSSSFLGADGMDQLSIRTGTGQGKFSYNAATREVSYGFTSGAPTVIGRLDDIHGGGSQDLKVIFNANATKAVVDALIDNVQWANNDDSPSDVRILTLRLTDGTGRSAQQARVMNITPVNDAPSLNDATLTAPENQTAVTGAITGTDPDAETGQPSGLSFSLVAGAGSADNALFTIHASTGVLAFVAPPNYEDPAHAAGYSIRVRATDAAGATAERVYAVAVTNVNEFHSVLPIHGNALEDGPAITLNANITDPDVGEVHTITLQTAETLGSITANGGTFTYSPTGAFEHLRAGETATDSFFYKVEDALGRWSSVRSTVTVTGVNDVAVIGGTSTGSAREDVNVVNGKVTASGQLTITDPDSGQAAFQAFTSAAGIGGIGTFSVDASGAWTWEASNASLQSMGGNLEREDNIAVRSLDGSTYQTLGVTVRGSNDEPVAQALSGTLIEDVTTLLSPSFIDVDTHDLHALTIDASTAHGQVQVDPGSSIRYSAYGFDYLLAGETAQDVFSYTVTDAAGSSSTASVTLTVVGTNDIASIRGNLSANVTEDAGVVGDKLVASGELTVFDPDQGQSRFAAASGVAGINGLGVLSITEGGSWTVEIENAHPTIQALAAGSTTTDTFSVTSIDGSRTRELVVTITGTNDAPVITSGHTGTVRAPGHFDDGSEDPGVPTANGTVTAVDDGGGILWSSSGAATYGHFQLAADGQWSYQLRTWAPELPAILEGQVVTDMVTVTATDSAGASTSTQVQVQIQGTNDFPLPGNSPAVVFEPVNGPGRTYVNGMKGFDSALSGGKLWLHTFESAGESDHGSSLVALDGSGVQDLSMGFNGRVALPENGHPRHLAAHQGGLLVAGDTSEGANWLIGRRNADGSVDQSFGNAGTAEFDPGSPNTYPPNGMQVTPDGKFVVYGAGPLKNGSAWHQDLTVVRYNANGTVDTAFGENGMLPLQDHPQFDSFSSVHVAASGEVIVWGNFNDTIVISKFDSTGSLDTAFGSGGTVTIATPNAPSGGSLVMRSGGELLLASTSLEAGESVIKLTQVTATGVLDGTFGNGGIATTPLESGYTEITDLSLDGEGRVLLGFASSESPDLAVARFAADGTRDAGFGTGGVATADFGQWERTEEIVVGPDGNIWVVGTREFGNYRGWAIARFDDNGAPDTTFGNTPNLTTIGRLSLTEDDVGLHGGWSGGGPTQFGSATLGADGNWIYTLDPAATTTGFQYDAFDATITDDFGATFDGEIGVILIGASPY